jgi:hypothetical protein
MNSQGLVMNIEKETELRREKIQLQKELARLGLDKARKLIRSFNAPAPKAVDLLDEGEECFAKGDYTMALEFAVKCGDELKRIRES